MDPHTPSGIVHSVSIPQVVQVDEKPSSNLAEHKPTGLLEVLRGPKRLDEERPADLKTEKPNDDEEEEKKAYNNIIVGLLKKVNKSKEDRSVILQQLGDAVDKLGAIWERKEKQKSHVPRIIDIQEAVAER
ncbi:hypothetical protein X777_12965 [Ooceraea biroi]|uniref:Uncharacterized protein n=1 Tax=Ooceraea biroi TaxID=2015173 RepID=A0A026VYS6_OOCBI|nr:hypothetical protein X777_12965 [Ooceraea biroi]